MEERKIGSMDIPMLFLMIDSADHVTGKTGLSPTVTISKNGQSFVSAQGAVTSIGNGWYALAGNASDRSTLGELILHAEAAGADPWDYRYVIVPWNIFDPNLGLAYLDAPVSSGASENSVQARPTLEEMESSEKLTGGKRWPR